MSAPSKATEPELGLVMPRITRPRVVLPLPLSPATATISGRSARIERSRFSSATKGRFLPMPPPNLTVTPFRSRRLLALKGGLRNDMAGDVPTQLDQIQGGDTAHADRLPKR